jgi:hypothetical protein
MIHQYPVVNTLKAPISERAILGYVYHRKSFKWLAQAASYHVSGTVSKDLIENIRPLARENGSMKCCLELQRKAIISIGWLYGK